MARIKRTDLSGFTSGPPQPDPSAAVVTLHHPRDLPPVAGTVTGLLGMDFSAIETRLAATMATLGVPASMMHYLAQAEMADQIARRFAASLPEFNVAIDPALGHDEFILMTGRRSGRRNIMTLDIEAGGLGGYGLMRREEVRRRLQSAGILDEPPVAEVEHTPSRAERRGKPERRSRKYNYLNERQRHGKPGALPSNLITSLSRKL